MAQFGLSRPPPRVVTRVAIDFLLQSLHFVTAQVDGDILAGLAVLALLQGKSQSDEKSFEGETARSRDRRPVSVQSLARSLKTPPETMRRCVVRLIEKGWCVRVPKKGVVVSDNPGGRAKIERLMSDIRVAFLRMLFNLKQINFDFDLMDRAIAAQRTSLTVKGSDVRASSQESASSAEPNSSLDRIILDFGLRIVDGATSLFSNDYVLTCVFSAIMSANASPIAYDPQQAWRYASYEAAPPDEERRPVSLLEVSRLLSIPYETTRRYANTLIARGACIRDGRKALLIPVAFLQSPTALAGGLEIVKRFVQMVGELKRLGFDFETLAPPHSGESGAAVD